VVCVVKQIASATHFNGNAIVLDESVRAQLRSTLVSVAQDANLNQSGKVSLDGVVTFSSAQAQSATPAQDKIAATKQLFASLRTNFHVLSNAQHTGDFDLRLDAVRSDFEKAIAPMDKDLLHWSQMVVNGIDRFNKYRAGLITQNVASPTLASQADACAIYSDAAATMLATSPANAHYLSCTYRRGIVPGSTKWNSATEQFRFDEIIDHVVLSPADVAGKFTYNASLTQEAYAWAYNPSAKYYMYMPVSGVPAKVLGSPGSGRISYTMDGRDVSSINFNGTMPARTTSAGQPMTDYESWNLSAQRTSLGGGLYRYDFGADLKSFLSGAIIGRVTLNPGTFATVALDANGNLAVNGVKEYRISLTGEAGSSKITGDLDVADGATDKNGKDYQPNRLVFSGSISNGPGTQDQSTVFSGTLRVQRFGYAQFDSLQPVSASNFVRDTASLSGTITVPSRPALMVNINASHDAVNNLSVLGQYDDGSNVINVSLTDNGNANRTLKVGSSAGVTFSLYGNNRVADVMKDSSKVGWLDLNASRISYIDGSFESF
jgi:hypothetical protein